MHENAYTKSGGGIAARCVSVFPVYANRRSGEGALALLKHEEINPKISSSL